MASRALTTGALTRAPIFANIMTQIGAAGTVPGTPLALSPANRAWIDDMIETLIGVLDHAAGDPDLEDGDLDRCLAGEDGPPIAPAFDAQWRAAA